MHWWTFCAYLLGAIRTEGSLTAAAVGARTPLPNNADKYTRRAHRAALKAWALPPTEDELREAALARF